MSTSTTLYPLLFEPIFKSKVWGGTKLREVLQKDVQGVIGESWEISGVAENISLVQNGPFKGVTITSLLSNYKEDLVGKRVYDRFGMQFPLLFKFIDASKDLSIQVHPNDTIAQSRHNSFGKTEMWYVVHADKEARLILGFKEGISKEDYLRAIEEGTVESIMREVSVKKGDAFFLKPGTVHAIGGGIVLAEIQQSSDITYRIYDWNRPDTDGKFRELHIEEALDVMDFSSSQNAELQIQPVQNTPTILCESSYFHTSLLKLTQPVERDYSNIDSFVVYMCVEGSVEIKTDATVIKMEEGTTLLIPACLDFVLMETTGATILEVYIPSA